MKVLILMFYVLVCSTNSFGQAPNSNKKLNGKKVGFWSEIIPCDTIDSDKKFHTIYHAPDNPEKAWAEGTYIGGLKDGFWKEYWVKYVPKTEYLPKGAIARGSVKAIREYQRGLPVGLFVEYHRNGNIKVVGAFENPKDTDEIPKYSPWYFYDESGQSLQK